MPGCIFSYVLFFHVFFHHVVAVCSKGCEFVVLCLMLDVVVYLTLTDDCLAIYTRLLLFNRTSNQGQQN